MSRSRPDRVAYLRTVRRRIRLTELAGLALLQVVLWLAYRRQRLRWQAQGAVARWEHDLGRGHPRAGRPQAPKRAYPWPR